MGVVYSTSVGTPFKSKVKPTTRRKLNLKNKGK